MKNDVFSVTFIKAKTASRGEGDEMMMKETNPQIATRRIQNSTKYFPQRILGILLKLINAKITVFENNPRIFFKKIPDVVLWSLLDLQFSGLM